MSARLAAAVLLLAAAGRADQVSWSLQGCAQSTHSSLTLGHCGSCSSEPAIGTFIAPVQGTLTMRLDWTVTGPNFLTSLYVHSKPGIYQLYYAVVAQSWDGWCSSFPCSGSEPSIRVHLLAGQELQAELRGSDLLGCLGIGATTCTFSDVEFTPDVGFVTGPGALDTRVITDVPGTTATSYFGIAVVQPGDLDGDGVADFAASGNLAPTGIDVISGYSGATGALLFSLLPPPSGLEWNEVLAAPGDVDGDGLGDLLIGCAACTGSALLVSGADGHVLLTLPSTQAADGHAWAVSAIGDQDLDGVPDLLVSAVHFDVLPAQSNGIARVHSGVDGSVLLEIPGGAGDELGTALASPGDVTGDGVPDVLAGAWEADTFGPDQGALRLFSGADGALLGEFGGPADDTGFGREVAAAGDLDGDGVGDFAASSPHSSFGFEGEARAWSGATHELLFNHVGALGSSMGLGLAPAGDWDGDGFGDLAVGASYAGAGEIRLFAGPDGHELGVITSGAPLATGFPQVEQFGRTIAGGGDVNGDGVPDLVVGASSSKLATGLASVGRVFVISGDARDHEPPRLVGTGSLVAGSPLELDVRSGPAGGLAWLVLGSAKLNAPFHGGALVPQPQVVLPLALDGSGGASILTHWPAGVPSGANVWLQAWCPQAAALHGWVATASLQVIAP